MFKYTYFFLFGIIFLASNINAEDNIPNIAHTIWLGGVPSSLGPAKNILDKLPDDAEEFELNIWIYDDKDKAPISTDDMNKFIEEMKEDIEEKDDDDSDDDRKYELSCAKIEDTIFIECNLSLNNDKRIGIKFRNINDILPEGEDHWTRSWVNFYTGLKTSFSNHYAGASDLLRFLILSKYGGHYMDYKSQPKKSLYNVPSPIDGILVTTSVTLYFPVTKIGTHRVSTEHDLLFGLRFINIDNISSMSNNKIIEKVIEELKKSYEKITNSNVIKFAIKDSLLTATRRYYTLILNDVPLTKVLFSEYAPNCKNPSDEIFEVFTPINKQQISILNAYPKCLKDIVSKINDRIIGSTTKYYEEPPASLSWDRFFYLDKPISSSQYIVKEGDLLNIETATKATVDLVEGVYEQIGEEYTEELFTKLKSKYGLFFNGFENFKEIFTEKKPLFTLSFKDIPCCSTTIPIIRIELFKILYKLEQKNPSLKATIKELMDKQLKYHDLLKESFENKPPRGYFISPQKVYGPGI